MKKDSKKIKKDGENQPIKQEQEKLNKTKGINTSLDYDFNNDPNKNVNDISDSDKVLYYNNTENNKENQSKVLDTALQQQTEGEIVNSINISNRQSVDNRKVISVQDIANMNAIDDKNFKDLEKIPKENQIESKENEKNHNNKNESITTNIENKEQEKLKEKSNLNINDLEAQLAEKK